MAVYKQGVDLIGIVLRHLDASAIYPMAFTVAETLWPIVGIVMALAILFRTVTDMYSGVTGGQFDWPKIFLDVFLWSMLLASYILLVYPVVEFFNYLYSWFESNGSLNTVTMKIADTVSKINGLSTPAPASYQAAPDAGEMSKFFGKEWHDTKEGLKGLVGYAAYGGAYTAYLVTFVIAAAVGAFLDIGHAFFFNLVYIWGMFAIPLAITSNIKIVATWVKVAMFVMVWPLFTALVIFFFQAMFIGAAEKIGQAVSEYSLGLEAAFYIGFAILNLVIVASLIAAPFIAQAFIVGSGITPALFSFASAGVGAGLMASRAALAPYKTGKSAIKSFGDNYGKTSFNRNASELANMIQSMKGGTPSGKPTSPGGASNQSGKSGSSGTASTLAGAAGDEDFSGSASPSSVMGDGRSDPTVSGNAGVDQSSAPATSTEAAVAASHKIKRTASEQRMGVFIDKAKKAKHATQTTTPKPVKTS